MNFNSSPFPENNKYSLFFILCVCLFVSVFLSSCSKVESATNAEGNYVHSAKLLTIAPVEHYFVAQQYVGKISAKQFANISFEYNGTVNDILVDSGDIVKKGQVLAKQDTELLNIKIAQLNAQIKQTKAQLTLNKNNVKRLTSLIGDGYTSEKSLDELTAEQEIFQAKLQEFDANVRTINYQIAKATLRAPYSATVGKRLISKGEFVAAGKTTFSLIAQDNNEIVLGVPSKIATDLTLQDNYPVEIGNYQSSATLIAIGQQVDPINRTIQLRLVLSEKMTSLNGQLVRVSIKRLINKTGFWLPLNAITDGIRGQWNIFIAKEKGSGEFTLQAETIQVIHATKNQVFVTGLSKNSHTIVADGLHRLVPGQTVKASKKESSL
jgi:RND family efflux transporter MFP subunit